MADLNALYASEYDSATSYAAGDRCVYEKEWYECKTATTGAFDADKWEKKYLVDYLNSNLVTEFIIPKYVLVSDSTVSQYNSYLFINTKKYNKCKIDSLNCSFKIYGDDRAKTITTNGTANTEYNISNVDLVELIIYKTNAVSGTEYIANNIRFYN